MHEFEIRVLTADQRPSFILPGPLACVTRALRTARGLALAGNILEVWRDDECVYQERLDGVSA